MNLGFTSKVNVQNILKIVINIYFINKKIKASSTVASQGEGMWCKRKQVPGVTHKGAQNGL